MTRDSQLKRLSWAKSDIEQRLGFRGGSNTRVNNLLSFLIGAVITVVFYLSLTLVEDSYVAEMFTQRGPTPYFIVFFTAWSLAILVIKWRKLALQRRALKIRFVPQDHDFVLSPATVQEVIDKLQNAVDDPSRFLLFNRILVALSNLKNLGHIHEVDEILRSQSQQDESSMETSYSLVRGFVWAIPVLGFIGTVLGLSRAIGGFGAVLSNTSDISQITESLKTVTGGLAVAFETTLEALVAALVIQLLLTFLKKSEEEFLDACSDYSLRFIVSRLRFMPYEPQAAAS